MGQLKHVIKSATNSYPDVLIGFSLDDLAYHRTQGHKGKVSCDEAYCYFPPSWWIEHQKTHDIKVLLRIKNGTVTPFNEHSDWVKDYLAEGKSV